MATATLYFLPRLLRFARERAKLSQRELAELVGTVQPAVVGWEKGDRATSEETLSKVARALGHASVERFLCKLIPIWAGELPEVKRRLRRVSRRHRLARVATKRAAP